MDLAKKERSVARRLFTKYANELEAILQHEKTDVEWHILHQKLDEMRINLKRLDSKIKETILVNFEEDELEKEMEDAMRYQTKWLRLHALYNEKISTEEARTENSKDSTLKMSHIHRNYKLPKLQLTTFDGELKNWLAFWGQFSKIHNDTTMDDVDKHQYLIQSMKEYTEVRSLVESFPPTAYEDCISQIKARYAREELLIQVYVREILALVLMKKETTLTQLYDKLNANLRALDALGVTKDKYAAFLLPMVESAMSQELLRTWERTRISISKDVAEELACLLEFLKKEVDGEQRIKITRETFQTETTDMKRSSNIPTAECLLSNAQKTQPKKLNTCIWCEKETHSSLECYKGLKMTIEQRRAYLKDKKACAICLRKGHHPKVCRASVKCLRCGKRHSTLLCQEDTVHSEETSKAATLSTMYPRGETLLQTVIVEIECNNKKLPVRALFDSGSQRTYIKQEVVDNLKIPPCGKEVLAHSLFGGVETRPKEYNVYDVKLKSTVSSFNMNVMAISQSQICGNVPKRNPSDIQLNKLLCDHNIALTDREGITDIGMLIGADFLGFLLTGTMIQLREGLVAINTRLGWTLQGTQVCTKSSNNLTTLLHCKCDNLSGYWALETLGIQDPVEVKTKLETATEIMTNFETTIAEQDDRYVVQLPFKSNYQDLHPNYGKAKMRLEVMSKRLVSSGRFEQYDSILKNWENLGVIEKVKPTHDTGHFLPHRPVMKEQSLTCAMRPVFDASATDKNGLSLNACLEKGINLIDCIPNLIHSFRKGVIGITSDIEKAFLQISLKEQDRDFLKFLWYQDNTMKEIITYRHCRVVFGLTSSPFLLSATLQHHIRKMKDGPLGSTAETLEKSLYVDNCLVSVNTEEEANRFIEEAKKIMLAAKFNLRMWVTSQGINETGKTTISVLGLQWDTVSDKLYCNNNSLPPYDSLQCITKRDLLSLTQKVYDPIGYTSPVMLTPKLILQETWRRQLTWDEELPHDLIIRFKDWYKYIHFLKDCRIPRRITTDILNESKVSLHLFSDASQNGYGICVMLRAEKGGNVTVQLISAKARVTASQRVTIPRAELIAALLGARLLSNVRDSLSLTDCPEYCWTDSAVALCWIKRDLAWNTFVGNRVKEIRQHTNTKNWYHIPGEYNWADLASRGCTAKTLFDLRWWEGPSWLYLPPGEWPRSELVVDEREVHRETKKSVCNTSLSKKDNMLHALQSYFSKYSKLIRSTAWVLRFLHNIRHVNNKRRGEITFMEYDKAEKAIIRLIQQDSSEIMQSKSGNLTKFDDKEGLVRIKTKLLLSDLPEYTRTPYLLPAKHTVVALMVTQRHVQLQHAGTNQLIADLRTRYWIIGIRRLVRSVISSCMICTRYRSKPTQAPAAPLPNERITCLAPFQTTGVDLAGPLHLRGGEKCWIVLYTCAVYRAVHLELTRSLSTEAFIMTLRRFIARRGRVHMLMSDQGTNFHGTKNLLTSLNWDAIQTESTIRRINWKMNAPSAAWWGGYWERLIRIMKDLLRRILGKASISYIEFETLLCDVEATMNGRPLTYINDDKGECLEPLTPAHFIQPLPNSDVTDLDFIDANNTNSRLRYLQMIREQFRQRFKSEYLTVLIQKGNERTDDIAKGDIVLVESDEKRVKWPLGILEELYTGKDGVQRTARVKTATGIKIRPVQRLYKLEVSGNNFPLIPTAQIPTFPNNNKINPQPAIPDSIGSDGATPSLQDNQQQSTRCGRKVRFPSKYDLYI